ncbi:MAG: acyl-homoserine-lactone synthase [Pseudomonadota bacterium]
MFVYITPTNRGAFVDALAEMHRLRKRVFHDRLGWDVQLVGDQEVDIFDAMGAHYLVAMDDATGRARMCVRLVPTTGRYMLADTFPVLLHGQDAPRAPSLWESSRFAVDLDDRSGASKRGVSCEMCALLAAMNEVALAQGWRQIVTVTDVIVERLIKRAGYPLSRFGDPVQLGVTKGVAGYMEMSRTALAHCREVGGLAGPVVTNLDQEIRFEART